MVLAVAGCGPAPAQAPHVGYWHVQGSTIRDESGAEVRFSGVNFGGFESGNYALHGTWGGIGRNWKTYLDQIQSLGLNLVRVPFAGDSFTPGRMPLNVDYGTNPELQGKTTLQFLDLLVDECGKRGLRVILGYHRIQAGAGAENGLWYVPGSSAYTEQYWIDTWKALAARYAGNATVVGFDLFNEVHAGPGHPGPFWSADGADEPYNWRTAAKRAAEAILSVNPGALVVVQGMDRYGGELGWWGANLMGLRDHPFDVSKPGQVVYEVHDYGPNVFEQPWHADPAFPSNLSAFWDRMWGFVQDQGIGPVFVGEWGSRLDAPKEQRWATALRDYIAAKGLSWTWWTWTPTSPDTGGILEDDWRTAWPQKVDLLRPIEHPGFR
jgi:endoglucanase